MAGESVIGLKIRPYWVVVSFLLIGFTGLGCQRRSTSSVAIAPAGQAVYGLKEIAEHNRAVALMGQFNYEAAHDVLAQLAQRHPNAFELQVDLAIATLNRRQAGDSESAQSKLQAVLNRDPKHLRALYCLGILKLDGGDPQVALEMFQKVATLDPSDAYAQYYTGQCLFQMGQVEQALEKFKQTIPLDPYLRSAYYGAFQACLRSGRKTEADDYRKAFERLEGNPQSRLAEIKYTRMGPKATLQAADVELPKVARPNGPLFLSSISLCKDPMTWRTDWTESTRPHVTVGQLQDGGARLLFCAGASQDATRPNVILKEEGQDWKWQASHPLSKVAAVNAVLWGDYDNDGLTDVYLCRSGPNQLWRQVAPDQWQDVTLATGTSGGDFVTHDGQMFDADHDGDLDLFLANEGPNELLNNNLDGTFRSLGQSQGLTGSGDKSRSIVVLDLDRDRDLDLFVVKDQIPHEVYVNDRLWSYHAADGMKLLRETSLQSLVAADVDADGQTELWSWSDGGLRRWIPDADGQWIPQAWTLDQLDANITDVSLDIADFDGDGQMDLMLQHQAGWGVWNLVSHQRIHQSDERSSASRLLSNGTNGYVRLALTTQGLMANPAGPGRFQFLEMQLTGKAEQSEQMRSNRSGIGAWVAARRGSRWTSVRTLRNDSHPGQSLQSWPVGLGGQRTLDFVAVTWPDGVYQTEFDLSVGKLHLITETQRQVASCPLVFVWDGSSYPFVTDVLGGGGIGFNLARGEYGEPRSVENLLLPENRMQTSGNKFIVKIAEPMEEVCYLDRAHLVQFQLGAGWKMTLDERFAVNGPGPTGNPIFYRHELLPIAAHNDLGESVRDAIAEADGNAAEPAARDPRFLGRTSEQTLILEFAEAISGEQLWLLMDGWIEYPYSQTMFAAWQAGAQYEAPSLDAQRTDGSWQTVLPNFGYPAGMPRQAAVPLDRSLLPDGTRRLRIRTNMEIYWDRLALIRAEAPSDTDVQRVEHPLVTARVAYAGFARRELLAQRRPVYNYSQPSPFGDSRHLRGFYSDWGSVYDLLTEVDDAFAVIGPGEEVHLEFKRTDGPLSSARNGWVLELNGWCKDMDLYTRDGETVEPLPRRAIARSAEEEARRRRLLENHRWRYQGGN